VLDYEACLFQNLAGTEASDFSPSPDGRIVNGNGHRPCFLHGNGPGLPVLAELHKEVPDIRVFLRNYQQEDIIYIANPGNAGDSLIAFGTIQLFNELGLRWAFGRATDIYHDKVLFYAGGGNLVGMYDDCKIFLQNNKGNNNRIVVLPHTIKDEDTLIKSLDSNVILFCRERTSFHYVQRLARHKHNVYLSKDMAFYIQDIDKYKMKQNNTQTICHAFRMDCEQTDISIPDDNIDLSHHLNMPDNTHTNIEPVSMRLLEHLSNFDVVRTNRLHICIAGHLLGKTVHFYPNSYYKNQAVYEYSLRDDANVLMSPNEMDRTVFDPVIYLINLKTDVRKFMEMKNMFHKLRLKYRVFEGVEGLSYPLTKEDLQYLQDVDYDIHLKKGVVGCHLSHIRLLEQFVASNEPYLIVCEDNVKITDTHIHETLQKIQQLDFTIVFLCCTIQPPSLHKAHELNSQYSLYNCGNTWYGQGTRCYIISKTAASDILQKYYGGACTRAIDWFYLDHISNPLVIYPSLCQYDGSKSAIEQRGGH
jgi:exopolysaccharide biosynthesis predicted pyruvyltransferase EpsI/GR25 family glycosyltransferase involved in LPS biosynthesis